MSDQEPFELLRRAGLTAEIGDAGPLRHVRTLPARQAHTTDWPDWVPTELRAGYRQLGVSGLYTHQVHAAEALHAGRHTILATGTASGKSLGTQLPGLAEICGGPRGTLPRSAHGTGGTVGTGKDRGAGGDAPGGGAEAGAAGDAAAPRIAGSAFGSVGPPSSVGTTMLYLSPTKALAADQLDALTQLAEATGPAGTQGGIRPASYDGDTDPAERRWIRQHANVVLSNPDMLNVGILPNHRAWARFFARLRYVIIDEAHSCRGIFGSHIALLLRRLRRICAHYGAHPVFTGASATSGDPATSFSRLIGHPDSAVQAITEDTSPHGAVDVYLWEASYSSLTGDNAAPLKRSLTVEAADILTDLVVAGHRTLAFIKSRRGAETIAQIAADSLADVDRDLRGRVAAYRSGYLKEERRELEDALREGRLLGVASTPALELGIDISGLDAVIIAGWPGTRASFFQQLGRAGRSGQRGAAFFIAGDDPLDSYLLDHPEAIFDTAVEDAVTDPTNPHVAAPHILAAAQELPLTTSDLELFEAWLIESLTEQGHLRRRPRGWFFAHDDVSAAAWVKLRSDGGGPYTIVNSEDGTVIGDMGSAQAQPQAHPGAVYVHQGRSYIVEELDRQNSAVLVFPATPPYYTQARETTSIEVLLVEEAADWGRYRLHSGMVEVTSTVVGFQRKALGSSEVLSDEPLDLPPSSLRTQAMWITAPETELADAGVIPEHVPGALHAAEHAMIGLLPLLTSGDRWDIGGVSTALHRDTELPTIFVYDGHPGGAGFARRGFELAAEWIGATAETIAGCDCATGCPSCVQSPKCGNKNNPLQKQPALNLLRAILAARPERSAPAPGPTQGSLPGPALDSPAAQN